MNKLIEELEEHTKMIQALEKLSLNDRLKKHQDFISTTTKQLEELNKHSMTAIAISILFKNGTVKEGEFLATEEEFNIKLKELNL
jgi:hypothetical protein